MDQTLSLHYFSTEFGTKSVHTRDMDFVSDFVSNYFAFCTCADITSCLHFSHFVLNYFKFCWIYIVNIVGYILPSI